MVNEWCLVTDSIVFVKTTPKGGLDDVKKDFNRSTDLFSWPRTCYHTGDSQRTFLRRMETGV